VYPVLREDWAFQLERRWRARCARAGLQCEFRGLSLGFASGDHDAHDRVAVLVVPQERAAGRRRQYRIWCDPTFGPYLGESLGAVVVNAAVVQRSVGMNQSKQRKFFEEHKIRYVLAQFVDIHGAAKAKAVPVEHLDMVLTDGAGFAGFALWGFGMGPEGPDYMAVGDLVDPAGHSVDAGLRAAHLQRRGQQETLSLLLAGRAAGANRAAHRSAGSPCSPASNRSSCCCPGARTEAWVPPIPPTIWTSRATTTRACTAAREVLDEMVAGLRAVGIDVYQIDHEDGNGQFEINFTYADALKSADNFTFVKMAASEIAHKHGMIATFMPKPFSNRAGSGAHFHVSVGSAAQKNAFYDKNDKSGMGLSPMAYQFLAGVLQHARAFAPWRRRP
jgi:glutamine synthetase